MTTIIIVIINNIVQIAVMLLKKCRTGHFTMPHCRYLSYHGRRECILRYQNCRCSINDKICWLQMWTPILG